QVPLPGTMEKPGLETLSVEVGERSQPMTNTVANMAIETRVRRFMASSSSGRGTSGRAPTAPGGAKPHATTQSPEGDHAGVHRARWSPSLYVGVRARA